MEKVSNDALGRLSVEDFRNCKKTPIIVILDNVRSLLNVGSIFRTCDAFLVEKIYLCGFTGCPPHKDINKTALGATESVVWEYTDNVVTLSQRLKQEDVQLIPIEQVRGSIKLHEYRPDFNRKMALVFGNEVGGVSQDVIDMADGVIEVPQFGTKHSLNISVCAGVVIWDIFSKLLNR